jgi:hypothetical protein
VNGGLVCFPHKKRLLWKELILIYLREDKKLLLTIKYKTKTKPLIILDEGLTTICYTQINIKIEKFFLIWMA